jgi:hypothetical protein
LRTRFIGEDNRPYTYSRRWRMKFNLSRFITAKCYKKTSSTPVKLRGAFWANLQNFRYDEYFGMGNFTQYYLKNLVPTTLDYQGIYPFREIGGIVVTHDIGNGENDYQLDKLIVDAQCDTKSYGPYQLPNVVPATTTPPYTYNAALPDPIVNVELRNTSYMGETPRLTFNAIAQNLAASPGINILGPIKINGVNPWSSRSNTPGGTSISANDVAVYRESLALVVPFGKYRRCRVYLESSQKMTTIRSIQVFSTEFARRTYG